MRYISYPHKCCFKVTYYFGDKKEKKLEAGVIADGIKSACESFLDSFCDQERREIFIIAVENLIRIEFEQQVLLSNVPPSPSDPA